MDKINLITLKCSNCSAALKISDHLDRFICNYCGTEQLLVRENDGFAFKRIEAKLESIEKATERGNAELALKRLREDLQIKMVQYDAIEREKNEKLRNIEQDRELSIKTLVAAGFFQMIGLKFDIQFAYYTGFQVSILAILLYQLHQLGILQENRQKVFGAYKPDLEQVNNEIEKIEIKIKNKIKIVDR